MKPYAILLDLNGVIEDTSQFHAYREHLVLNALSDAAPTETVAQACVETRQLLQRTLGHALPEFHLIFWEEMLRRCGAPPTYSRTARIYERFLDSYLPTSALFSDVRRFLPQAKASAKLGVLSNANSLRARRFLEYHGIHDAFDAITISHDTPCTKPDRELFRLACARLGVEPREALMVGDRVDNDATGARDAGMAAVLLTRSGTVPSGYAGETARSLDEVRARILELPLEPIEASHATVAEMVAVVVCGGRGTRLAAVTQGRQKCLTDIQGKPILHYVLDRLLELGIRRYDFIAGASAADVDACVRPYLAARAERIRVLPIIGESTGASIAMYWQEYREPSRDILYTHGNIIVQPDAARRLVMDAVAAPDQDIVVLASPEWVADTHPGLVSRNGNVVQIHSDVNGNDRRGLCSVGMAVVRRHVNLTAATLPPKSMFEDIVDRERTAGRITVGCCFTDTPWEHLGTPADFARLNGAHHDLAQFRLLSNRPV